jgi:signal peptidase II
MPITRRCELLLLVLVIALDQLTKLLILKLLPPGGVALTSFVNLVLVWNTGVSFGMFRDAAQGRWILVLVTLAIGAFLVFWLRREHRLVPRLAIHLILGGAIGNLIDRIRFGAVVDFLDAHLMGYHWPAFNVADSAIVVGAAVLLLDGLFAARPGPNKAEEKG